jgi:hypothetical protein
MTLTLTLPPETEAALKDVAQAQGVSAEQWLQHLVEERLRSSAEPPPASSQTRRPLSARIREIWSDLPEEARAEYPEGGAYQIDHHVYGLPKR